MNKYNNYKTNRYKIQNKKYNFNKKKKINKYRKRRRRKIKKQNNNNKIYLNLIC